MVTVQQHLNNPPNITPNTHTDTPKLIVAKPAPTKRKHCKRISFHGGDKLTLEKAPFSGSPEPV